MEGSVRLSSQARRINRSFARGFVTTAALRVWRSEPMSHRVLIVALVAVVVIVAGVGALYQWLVPGLSSARTEQGPVETGIATWLLHRSVPAQAKAQTNPLANDPAEIAAGSELFKQKCEICHAYDGGGKTEIGSGEYPRPPALRSMDVTSMSDGEIFYHIRNGIRNTGMPAWQLPDQQIWQLVAFIRHLPGCRAAYDEASDRRPRGCDSVRAICRLGRCQKCHEDIYARWSKSRMANVVRDPRQHPDAIIPNFSKPNPLLTFSKDDIAFVYGSRWKQRYFTKIGDDYFPQPAQWDVTHGVWKRYFVPNSADWWAPLYPPDNFKRADWSALRRLPLSELRHRDQNRQRMERRLRKVSRSWQRPR